MLLTSLRSLVSRSSGLLLASLLVAAPAMAEPPLDAAPDVLLRTSTENVIERIRTERAQLEADPNKIYELVNEEVLPALDVPYVTALILGRHYRDATPDQRREFADAFAGRMIRRYGEALLEYSNEKVTYLPVTVPPGETKVKVRSSITPSSGVPVPIIFSMRQGKDNRWRIYDVSVDGISMVTNYRTQFDSRISKDGLDAVIAQLQANALQLEGESAK